MVPPDELDVQLDELETRVERLRALYEQYFLGIEKIEPLIARKDIDRRIWVLRREQIRNTGKRFRLQGIIQRYNTFQQYWMRICREIENGTYRRHLVKAERILGDQNLLTLATQRRFRKKRPAQEAEGPAPAAEAPPPEPAAAKAAEIPAPPKDSRPAFENFKLSHEPSPKESRPSLDPLDETRRLMDQALGESDAPPARGTSSWLSVPSRAALAAPRVPRTDGTPVAAGPAKDARPPETASPPSPSLRPGVPLRPGIIRPPKPIRTGTQPRSSPIPDPKPRSAAPPASSGAERFSPASPPQSSKLPTAHPPASPPATPSPRPSPMAPLTPAAAPPRELGTPPLRSRLPSASTSAAQAPLGFFGTRNATGGSFRLGQASGDPRIVQPSGALAPPTAPREPAGPRPAAPRTAAPAPAAPAPAAPAPATPREPAVPRPASAVIAASKPPPRRATPVATPKPTSSIGDDQIRELHSRLVAAKQETKEAGQVSLDGLRKTLAATETKLRAQHGANRRIDFAVVIKDGKAILKPTVR